jgi:hypothetical protein
VLLERTVFELLVVALVRVISLGWYLGSKFHKGLVCLLLHIDLEAGVDVFYIVNFLQKLSDELLVLCSFNMNVSENSRLGLSLSLMCR